jgi:hypothetical protein
MKKLGLLFLVLLLALGGTGAAFAHWSQTLTIDTTVETGTLICDATVTSNDPPGTLDPGSDPPKDTGTTTVTEVSKELVEVLLTNAYPCYNPELTIEVANVGSIPFHIYVFLHFKADGKYAPVPTWDTVPADADWIPMLACDAFRMVPSQWYQLDLDNDCDCDVAVHLIDLDCQQVEPGLSALGGLQMHVLQTADQDDVYKFNVELVQMQWNMPAPLPEDL